jgi:hypothetical protein
VPSGCLSSRMLTCELRQLLLDESARYHPLLDMNPRISLVQDVLEDL